MDKEIIHLLVVDDEEVGGKTITDYFNSASHPEIVFKSVFFSKGRDAFQYFLEEKVDVILLEIKLEDMDGMELLKNMKELKPLVEVILLTRYGDWELTIKSLKLGAYDFLSKPFDLQALEKIVLKAYERKVLKNENRSISKRLVNRKESQESQAPSSGSENDIITENRQMQEILKLIDDISGTDCNVLIQGESGTGKEMIARLIHKKSQRNSHLFFPINCGAIPENLIESELFGYEKGAFTGAMGRKTGLFEVASQGSLFLDEIGDLPITFQVKLLRVLETGEFNHIGGTKILTTHARIISASNKELKKEVEKNVFRSDLYYRLNVITIVLPPLRERKEDISLLVNYFIIKQSQKLNRPVTKVSKEAMQLLVNYDWPGNVRELQNFISRVIILTEENLITPEIIVRNLPIMNQSEKKIVPKSDTYLELVKKNELITLNHLEERYIRYVLEKSRFNKSKASQILDISDRTLYRKIKEYGISEERK